MDATTEQIRLGINIDHVATIRQLRGTPYPNLIEAATKAVAGGASQITVHLREDRRHIQDRDVVELRKQISVPLNLEMGLTKEMVDFAKKVKPHAVCIVPEKRQELTTEGGLDLKKSEKKLREFLPKLSGVGIQISLFIEPDADLMLLAKDLGAHAVEIHTGAFCLARQNRSKSAAREFTRIEKAAKLAHKIGLSVHAGHGIDYENIRDLVQIKEMIEYNIGHSVIARSVMVGMTVAVREMMSQIQLP